MFLLPHIKAAFTVFSEPETPSFQSLLSKILEMKFSSFVVAAASIAGALATPLNTTEGFGELLARGGTPSSTGTSNGYYYSWWTDGAAQATYTNGGGGQYTLSWSGNNGNLVGGKDGAPEVLRGKLKTIFQYSLTC